MLIMSRQRDESIQIGDDILITVADIRGDKVRLGINAPTEIPVHRQEVQEAIVREDKRNEASILAKAKVDFTSFCDQLDQLSRVKILETLDLINGNTKNLIQPNTNGSVENLAKLCKEARTMETTEIKNKAREIGEQFAQVA